MHSSLTAERVRRDIEFLAHAGLDLPSFLDEAQASITRALGTIATCAATMDPATRLLTGAYKFGEMAGRDQNDIAWMTVELGGDEPTAFRDLDRLAVAMHMATGGDPVASPRVRECTQPFYGYGDELRVVAGVDGRLWGAMAFYRSPEDHPFDEEDVAFATSLSNTLGLGFRSSILTTAAIAGDGNPRQGPAVIVVDACDELVHLSVGAEEQLAELVDHEHGAASAGTIACLVTTARRFAAGDTDVLPQGRVRLKSGRWVVVHASPMTRPGGGAAGEICITIEDARPPEIVPLVVEAFGLSPRERDVTELVLNGAETREIAATLNVSPYTVQDHLKAVFDKANVRSRRELIAKVFFDQYAPRLHQAIGANGWFASS